jgi:hypothetical protein
MKVPDFTLVLDADAARHGRIKCDECSRESDFTVGGEKFDGKFYCKECFATVRPEYTEALVDFSELVDLMIEIKNSRMSLEEMHELYGSEEEPEN